MTAALSEPRRRTTGTARGRSPPVAVLYDFSSLIPAGFCLCSSIFLLTFMFVNSLISLRLIAPINLF
jgi:hypothetical protein